MRPMIDIPKDLQDAAVAFAHECCKAYRDGKKNASRRLQSPGVPAIWNDPRAQAIGRIGEVGACLYFGIDPMAELDWSPHLDQGWDFVLSGWRVDVKSSGMGSQYLIWPKMKDLRAAKSHAMIFAKVEADLSRVQLYGWVSMPTFRAEHKIAPRWHALAAGTPFMHQDALEQFSKHEETPNETEKVE